MRRAVSLFGSLLTIAACSSASSTHVSLPTPSTSTVVPTSIPPASTTAPALSTVMVSEADNGKTVVVSRNGTVTLVLHSTYWQVTGSSNAAVLAPDGEPTTAAQPPGSGCVPGGGCGTVTAHYTAQADGRATITAHRTTCGEALACSPDQSSYAVTVDVTG